MEAWRNSSIAERIGRFALFSIHTQCLPVRYLFSSSRTRHIDIICVFVDWEFTTRPSTMDGREIRTGQFQLLNRHFSEGSVAQLVKLLHHLFSCWEINCSQHRWIKSQSVISINMFLSHKLFSRHIVLMASLASIGAFWWRFHAAWWARAHKLHHSDTWRTFFRGISAINLIHIQSRWWVEFLRAQSWRLWWIQLWVYEVTFTWILNETTVLCRMWWALVCTTKALIKKELESSTLEWLTVPRKYSKLKELQVSTKVFGLITFDWDRILR